MTRVVPISNQACSGPNAVFVLSFFLSESLNLETVLVFDRLTLIVVQNLFKGGKGFLFLKFHCVSP